jgi:hypothetical protein
MRMGSLSCNVVEVASYSVLIFTPCPHVARKADHCRHVRIRRSRKRNRSEAETNDIDVGWGRERAPWFHACACLACLPAVAMR